MDKIAILTVSLLVAFTAAIPCPYPIAEAGLFPGFCASEFALGLNGPRGIAVSPVNGDLLVIESGFNTITALWDENGDGRSDSLKERMQLGRAPGLNHGIVIHGGYLYASSATNLYRWKYPAKEGPRGHLGVPQIVLKNMPCCHHVTRTPIFSQDGLLYISSGSGSNVDPDSSKSNIKRFNLTEIPQSGIDWNTGELFADGLRNEVGLAFDNQGRLWGVENGCDNLARDDLGGDIHIDNPSEEMNLFEKPGLFYGYPYCWSEYDLPKYGKGPGTQWAHPDFMNDGVHTDAWCRNTRNVVPPKYNFPAHMAPLDLLFYYGTEFGLKNVSFVSFHGSWNRVPAQGYRVDVVHHDEAGMPTRSERFFYHQGESEKWPNAIRPVGLALGKIGKSEVLFVSSDKSGQIISIGRQ